MKKQDVYDILSHSGIFTVSLLFMFVALVAYNETNNVWLSSWIGTGAYFLYLALWYVIYEDTPLLYLFQYIGAWHATLQGINEMQLEELMKKHKEFLEKMEQK